MSLSKNEVYQLLSSSIPEEIDLLLLELGYDPEANEYPENIIEQIEKCFNLVNDSVKRLANSKNDAIVIEQASDIIAQELNMANIQIPMQTIAYLAQGAIKQYQTVARVIDRVGKSAFVAELNKQQNGFYRDLGNIINSSNQNLQTTFSDKVIDKMVDVAVKHVDFFDIESFLADIKKLDETSKKISINSPIVNEGFDLESFLSEVNDTPLAKAEGW